MQSTNTVLLVKPSNFSYNRETAYSNAFQNESQLSDKQILQQVLLEFNEVVATLTQLGIETLILDDTKDSIKPDAIFPNNWISMHHDGKVILYPMQAYNRRLERRLDFVAYLEKHFYTKQLIDLSSNEKEDKFLEGTGSIVFDHTHKIAYACISPRTSLEVLNLLCEKLDYGLISFSATDKNGKAIYHTNVMMCITAHLVIICLESIIDNVEKEKLLTSFSNTKHQIIDISLLQMEQFAGNMLALNTNSDKETIVMSCTAFESLTPHQIESISVHHNIVNFKIPTIEKIGGGSIRCMIAEIFLQKKF